MTTPPNDDPKMCEEYDFSGGVRGKYVDRLAMNNTQGCPICSGKITPSDRYPKQVCGICGSRASDAGGRLLKFGNDSLSGGFTAHYADTGENYDDHMCYIDGIECSAEEHYFGGIVISVSRL